MCSKVNPCNWKKKAIERGAEIRKLRKQIAEIKISRQQWKVRFFQFRDKQRHLGTYHAPGHHYPLCLVWLCLYVYNSCQCSLRSCSQVVWACALLLELKCCRPCAATIRNWICKYGYYCYKHPKEQLRVSKQSKPPLRVAQQWALIIDESVAIGQERLLVVLAVALKEWTFKRPLIQTDVQVLFIGVSTSWKGADIAAGLEPILKSRSVAYCVSDKGNNIINALKISGLSHVYDCSHHWASITEDLYEQEADFKELMAAMAGLRRKWCLSRYAHIMPPQLRSKARFLNLFPLMDWIRNIERHWEKLDEPAKQCLGFVHTYAPLIAELTCLEDAIEKMGTLLKVKGLSSATISKCTGFLKGCKAGRPLLFKSRLLKEWACYGQLLEQQKTLLCSSDIVESFFARYKGKIKQTGVQAITESVLMMGGWSRPVTEQLVEEALCTVPLKEIYHWKKKNTTPSLLKKRRDVFSKNSTKNTS